MGIGDCEEEKLPEHADYPHEPGTLYDCPRCEAECFCSDPGKRGGATCVFCALLQERHQL